MRKALSDQDTEPYVDLFKAVYGKTKVKTYLTDRAQTGNYQTNREKRWETHPKGVQFSLRRQCMEIEYTLINQICYFDGFPTDLRERLERMDLLEPLEIPMRCPITMEALSFERFSEEILDPTHGLSTFQVGHLAPLKSDSVSNQVGHIADNISWITETGNRIQGSLSLQHVRKMLYKIFVNYQQAGLIPRNFSE